MSATPQNCFWHSPQNPTGINIIEKSQAGSTSTIIIYTKAILKKGKEQPKLQRFLFIILPFGSDLPIIDPMQISALLVRV